MKKNIWTDIGKIALILILILIVLIFSWFIIYFDKRHLYGKRCEKFSGNGSGRIMYCEICGGNHQYGNTNLQSNHLYHKSSVSFGIPATYDRVQYFFDNVCDDDRVLWPTY